MLQQHSARVRHILTNVRPVTGHISSTAGGARIQSAGRGKAGLASVVALLVISVLSGANASTLNPGLLRAVRFDADSKELPFHPQARIPGGTSLKIPAPRLPRFSGRAPAFMIAGTVSAIVILLALPRAITQRRRAEQALRQAQENFDELALKCQVGAQSVRQANAQLQKEIEQRTEAEEALACNREALLAEICERKSVEEELLQAHEDQEERVRQRSSALNLVNEALHDEILERQRAEEALRLAHNQLEQRVVERTAELARANEILIRKNGEIQNFYHTLSHELKTPLTSAREFIAIVMDGLAGPLNATQTEYLGIAKQSCNQLRVCINDLLDVTRLETGKLSVALKPASLAAVVQRMVTVLTPAVRAKKLTLTLQAQPDLPDVLIDESRLMQVITNLLNNALKFTDAGGIFVEVRESPETSHLLEVSVRDTGRGIPTDTLDKIFDRLYQVKVGEVATEAGVGLGLYICRELVLLHGGEIRVASELNKGSTFTFTIPKMPAAARGGLASSGEDFSRFRNAGHVELSKFQP